ncbi:uncharacterized protein LAESUDRAFT_246762 [Laetiporus sulphureus 93-53]|uniref:F-box domain-containing protein n=1 Tax=Laetiporus sulphureus 93-53 TaxID=1314785 RepID=A0A165DHS4_9APHY|nr:uncharacterized protein LAESUDRAFT_246762 [Laetiporus sulphureus 93-53]KZT04908.1 hypothetical protein LAESUDRAFT_246762 [Laetiporus sulphureus 93-53]
MKIYIYCKCRLGNPHPGASFATLYSNAMKSIKQKLKRLEDRTKKWRLNSRRLVRIIKGKVKAGRAGTCKVEAVATGTFPQLPVEVWENVINHLWDDQDALEVCICVCRAWYPPSRFHLHRQINIGSVQGVKAYVKVLKQTPEWSGWAHDMTVGCKDLSVLWPAALLLARKLPRLVRLTIKDSEWKPWTMHKDIFLHLSAFSITRLDLFHVTFPSLTVFGRLVCTLPGLVELKCDRLNFTHDHFHHETFGLYDNRLKIRSLSLQGGLYVRPNKLIDFLAHPCISNTLQKLVIDVSIYIAESQYEWGCQRLLDAASGSLSELRLDLPPSIPRGDEKVSAAALSFAYNTSLRRLWLTFYDISRNLDPLSQVLLSIKSGELREIVIVFRWSSSAIEINELKNKMKDLLTIYKTALYEKIDKYLASDSFGVLSRVEFALSPWHVRFEGRVVDDTVIKELWKQNLPLLFPRLTERGIFRATVRGLWYEGNF